MLPKNKLTSFRHQTTGKIQMLVGHSCFNLLRTLALGMMEAGVISQFCMYDGGRKVDINSKQRSNSLENLLSL